MFSYIKSFFWPENEEKNEKELMQDLGVDLLEREQKIGEGAVTELNEDYGMVDNKFYFSRSINPKISERPIRLGDIIQYKAFRKSEKNQWLIEEINYNHGPKKEWSETDKESPCIQTASSRDVGKVIKVQDEIHIEIQGEYNKETIKCPKNLIDFTCQSGDLVQIELALTGQTFDDLNGAKILKASPLRSLTVPDGSVTSWWHNMKRGVINSYM